jgi:hypothetical protein
LQKGKGWMVEANRGEHKEGQEVMICAGDRGRICASSVECHAYRSPRSVCLCYRPLCCSPHCAAAPACAAASAVVLLPLCCCQECRLAS